MANIECAVLTGCAPICIVALKAFGDLVIARTSIRRSPNAANVQLIIGEQLAELNECLGPSDRLPFVVRHGEHGVPALFDVRKRGIVRAMRSATRLRSAMALVPRGTARTLFFDQAGPRERFISWPRRIQPLPPAENVYVAYDRLLGSVSSVPSQISQRSLKAVGLFPSSRIERKNVPADIVQSLVAICHSRRLEPKIFLLDGERPDLEQSLKDAIIVPRSFAAMYQAVRSVDAVIAADSMPAHMAEHSTLPVFVITPADNRYWMPFSSYYHRRWALFEDCAGSDSPVAAFLDRLNAGTGPVAGAA